MLFLCDQRQKEISERDKAQAFPTHWTSFDKGRRSNSSCLFKNEKLYKTQYFSPSDVNCCGFSELLWIFQSATAEMLQFTPEICMEGKALVQSTSSGSDNPTEGFEGPNHSGLTDKQGQGAAPQLHPITQRWDGPFEFPHLLFHMAGDWDFALFLLPRRHRTNTFPSNSILIPHSCSEQNLHI